MSAWSTHQLATDLVSGICRLDKSELSEILGACPVCRSSDHTSMVSLSGLPVLSCELWDDRDSARTATTGILELVTCDSCRHIYNKAFDPELIEYTDRYENALEHSPTHRQYLTDLAETLAERIGLGGATVIDVGVGSGFLLKFMAERFGVTGMGIDPGVPDRLERFASGGSVRFVNGFFATCPGPIHSDLVCCLHLLEHLPAPWALLRQIRDRHHPQKPRIYIEVPNGELLDRPSGLWDLIYEHVSHFTMPSLTHLLQAEGYRVVDCGRSFGDQYLWFIGEFEKDPARPPEPRKMERTSTASHAAVLQNWRRAVRSWASTGRRVAIWGAGAKGSTFANLLDPNADVFSVFDVNPKKWDRHIPGSGHRIRAPQELATCRPDMVIAMNPLYTREITQAVNEIHAGARVLGIGEFEDATQM